MANSNYVKYPTRGINIICIDPLHCENTLAYSNTAVPILYGVTKLPTGFQNHDPIQCPSPRIAYLESVEDYWKQDFMKTFTDCLAASDFGPSISTALSISYLHSFQGSSRTQAHSTYSGSFSYKCCFTPSYYQAYVRGTKSTGYFNPIFSSLDDFNCVESEGCLGYGAMDSFYKAAPHSVMWYLLHSMASITLVTNSTSLTVPFWANHIVGQTQTSLTIRSTLLAQANLLGGPQLPAFTNTLAATTDVQLQTMVGNHYLLSLLTYNASGQNGGYDQYKFMCPNAPLYTDQVNENWRPTKVKDVLNFPFIKPTQNDTPVNTDNYPWFFTQIIGYNSLISNTELKTLRVLECCTRDQVGLGQVTVNKFLSFSANSLSSFTSISPQSYTSFGVQCPSMLCPNSGICHTILYNYCKYSESQTSVYCQRFNSWAARNYRSAFSLYDTTNVPLPFGAYATGVDTSIAAQVYACSQSKAANNTLSRYYNDTCVSLFSSTYQSNFPRLRTFHWGDPVTYLSQTSQMYVLAAKESAVNVVLTYTAYSFTQNTQAISRLLGTTNPSAFVSMPMQLSCSLASFSLTTKDIYCSNFSVFTSTVQQLFNTQLIALQGRFPFPEAPTKSFTQTFSTPNGLSTFTITPAYPNFSTSKLFWKANGLALTHTTVVGDTRSRFDVQRQQDINFLYSISSLRSVNANSSGTSFQNSSADIYASFSTVFNSSLVNPHPQGIVDSNYTLLPQIDALPTLSLQMNSNIVWSLGLSSNPTLVINPLQGGALSKGTYTQTFTNPLISASRSNLYAIYGAVFSITNISPVTISSLTASVSSNKLYNVQTLDPSGNPILVPQVLNYSVTFNTQTLAPQQSTLCTVSQTFFIGASDSSLPLFSTPIIFYDSFTNQTSLSAPDYPVLGGISAIRALRSAKGYVPYTDNRFSTFVSDVTPINGISYYSNQNVYGNYSLAAYAPIDLTLFPLTGGS
jgi:hypothetical protein